MKKTSKGKNGYIAYMKKMTVIRTAAMFAIALTILGVGIAVYGDRKNIATIIAVLGCLPAAKSAVNAIMFMRAKGCTPETADKISSVINGNNNGNPEINELYDLYLTSYSESYPVSHVCVRAGSCIGLCETDADASKIEKHISEHMASEGIKGYTVKIFNNADRYFERLKDVIKLDAGNKSENESICDMLMSISL